MKRYEIKYLTISSYNTFMVEFTGADTFKGTMQGINGYKFNYKLENGEGNELLNAEAECTFTPKSATTAWLQVNVKSDDFSGRIIFQMSLAE